MIERRSLLLAAAAAALVVPVQNATAERGCFVPEEYKHLKWHIIQTVLLDKKLGPIERAEWVNLEANGSDGGHWVRWGRCGDFPSLCHAVYMRPDFDQSSPYFDVDPRWFYRNG